MKTLPRWPLIPIAAPAAVAIWSGWVGLGGLCGFGLVQPFPGIVSWHLDTAITLPIGVEAYGAYALGAWLTPGTPERARAFARRSAIGAPVLGMLGQVVYHLLAAARAQQAPWPVTVLVACLPVVTLGFGAALTHLLSAEPSPAEPAPLETDPAPAAAPAGVPDPVTLRAQLNGHAARAEKLFAADITAGKVPGRRRVMAALKIGDARARLVQEHLRSLTHIP
jgi:hypothetical protein